MGRVSSLGRFLSTIAFGGAIAALLILAGTRDLEGYDHSFFSLDRGTAVEAVGVLGHPVYTLALGLGVRLPLHGNLGASPAAAIAPFVPAPLAYWLLITCGIAAAQLVVRHALEPLCERMVSWFAALLLFCSPPIVNYAIYDDWPETALTYCAFVACVFAPHALLSLLGADRSPAARRIGGALVAAVVYALLAASHQGYWPLLAVTLLLACVPALLRSDHPVRRRLTAVAILAIVSLTAVALQIPDILRELSVPGADIGAMRRFVQGPTGNVVLANLFPFGQIGARRPFTYLLLAIVAALAGLGARDPLARRLAVGGAVISFGLGTAASIVEPGARFYSPSVTWAFRDPAIAFAVFSGACASRVWRRPTRFGPLMWTAAAALGAAGLQGPVYAARLTVTNTSEPVVWNLVHPRWRDHQVWTRDVTPPAERATLRGLGPGTTQAAGRLALWPGTRERMRSGRRAATDFADAGYALVTAGTKQRTMHGLVRPNDLLFNQAIDLSPRVLCDAAAVAFLQLRYLVLPPEVSCEPWARLPGVIVDRWWQVAGARVRDDRARAIPASRVSGHDGRVPALADDSSLLEALVPLPETSVRIGTRDVEIQLDDQSRLADRALVLPVAYDSAWRVSSGTTRSAGGLLAVTSVDRARVTLEFVPDAAAIARALAMTVAQFLATIGLVGLAVLRPAGAATR